MRQLWIVILIFVLSSCPNKCPINLFTDPTAAIENHEAMRRAIRAIRAEARVDQRGKEGRVRGTVLMFVEHDNRVRFDVMTQFGPAAILTSNGERFAYSDLRKNRFIEGLTCPENIRRLLGISLSARQITLLLLGKTPVIENATSDIVCTSDGFYRITFITVDGFRQEVDLEPYDSDIDAPPAKQRLRLLRSEVIGPKGQSKWRVTYDDYSAIAIDNTKIDMPFRVRIEQPAIGTDTLVRFKKIDLNPKIPSKAFSQEPRAGMECEEVLCTR